MKDNELKIDTKDVEIGMYVSRIDRPWLDSPFLLQGFMINSLKDKDVLVENSDYCYIDITRSKVFKPTYERTNINIKNEGVLEFKRRRVIEDKTQMPDELNKVRSAHKTMTGVIKDMFSSLRATKKLDLDAARAAIKPMVDSIIRNPDALLWLNRLRLLDDYNYSHSLGTSVWAMSMGRQLGLPRLDIESLGIGGLLLDIGKTKIPEKILTKQQALDDKETEIIRQHVQYSLDLVDADKTINVKIRNMIAFHHERINGSGYPNALKSDQIPLFAKIAAIVDCYDAITSKRSYAKPLSAQQAVKKLYEWRGVDFQSELVEEFIQAIGMFPSGTLVELTSGEVAVVVTESRTRRLRPKIMLLLNADKSMREDYVMCNMMHTLTDENGKSLEIKHALPAGSYNIKPDDFFL